MTRDRQSNRRVNTAIIAVLLACSTPVPSYGAEPSDTATAREHYDAGAHAYSQGDYVEAIEQFLAADRIAPRAALSFDIARGYEALGERSLALRWYRDYLHRGGALGADVLLTVALLEKELENKGVQQVTVRSTPPRATLSIDGEPAGVTPWTADVPPGQHVLTITRDGYENAERRFALPRHEALDVDVTLTPISKPTEKVTDAPGEHENAEPIVAARARSRPSKPPSTSTSPETEKASSTLRTLGIAGMGVGGAALAGALAFDVLRGNAVDDAKKDPTQVGYASKLQTAKDRTTAARALFGTGAGLVVAGGVLFFVGSKAPERRTEIAAGCGHGGCGASVSGRF